MTHPAIAEVEARAGRGKLLPEYVEDVLIAKWLGITPDTLQALPIYWREAVEIVIVAQHRAQEATHGKQAR